MKLPFYGFGNRLVEVGYGQSDRATCALMQGFIGSPHRLASSIWSVVSWHTRRCRSCRAFLRRKIGIDLIDCCWVLQRIDRWFDNKLEESDRQLIKAHIAGCTSCQSLYDQMAEGRLELLVNWATAYRHKQPPIICHRTALGAMEGVVN